MNNWLSGLEDLWVLLSVMKGLKGGIYKRAIFVLGFSETSEEWIRIKNVVF